MARGEDTPVQQPNNNSLSDFNQLRDQHRFDSENLSNEFSNNNSYNNNNFEKNFYDMDNQKESNEWNVENTLDQSSNNSVNSALDNRFGLGNNNEDDNEDNDDYNDNAGNRQEAPSRYQAGNGYLDDNEDDEDDDFSQQDSAMGSRIQSPAEDPEHSFEAHDELKHRQEGALFGARIENDAPMHFDMENKYELENKGAISSDLADSRQINPKFSHLSNDHVDIESSGALAEHRNVIIVSVFFLCGFAWVCRKALFGILFRSKRNRRYRRVGNSDGYESNPDSTASGYASDRGCVQGLFKHGNYTMLGTTTGDNKNGADGDDISLGSGWSENENGEGGDQSWEKW